MGPYTEEPKIPLFASLTLILIGVVFGMFGFAVFRHFDPIPEKPYRFHYCTPCHSVENQRLVRMEKYFKSAGNPHPEKMARAVLATKRPKLLAAIAVKGEKNTPYTARRTGWKKRHSGAWQISEKDWGPVPHDPVGQALKADKILDELTDKRSIRKALSIYGGDRTDRYQQRVLAELQNIP